MEYMALATGIRVVLLPEMTGSAIMEYSLLLLEVDKVNMSHLCLKRIVVYF